MLNEAELAAIEAVTAQVEARAVASERWLKRVAVLASAFLTALILLYVEKALL